jgi:tyrosine aminotransferase
MPKGSMYMMAKLQLENFPEFSSCLEFSEALIREQSVKLFPGVPCFTFPGFIRIVLTVPEEIIKEACERINEFCRNHFQSQ